MSSVSSLYRRYLLVCSQWTIDVTKSGRDFGTHLRQQIPKLFPNSELTDLGSNELRQLEQRIEALERLNKNTYFRPSFGQWSQSTATGLTSDECKRVISTEELEYLDKTYVSSTLDRIKSTFGSIGFLRRDKVDENTTTTEDKVKQKV